MSPGALALRDGYAEHRFIAEDASLSHSSVIQSPTILSLDRNLYVTTSAGKVEYGNSRRAVVLLINLRGTLQNELSPEI